MAIVLEFSAALDRTNSYRITSSSGTFSGFDMTIIRSVGGEYVELDLADKTT